ncbi:MAG: dephospho-CoA kinase [Candidatus Riflebacteria bacterium]|nr:dephospho-CoA kinase [Candidatus Riflebacteria bacterium]
MLILGISGQTGAGKSTAAKILSSLGYGENLEVDSLGHDLLREPDTVKALTKAFGEDILTERQIDRKKLGAKAFFSAEATEKLNSIMHPNMVKMVERIITEEQKNGTKSIIINAALLYKMKLDKLCDKIIYVKSDPEIRVKRLMETRGWSETTARERLFSQDQEPADKDVIIIENNGSVDDLRNKLQTTSSTLFETI